MWVRSEYAGELAVLSAWLAAFLPWNVHYSKFGALGSTLFVRFPFVQIQYTWLPTLEVDGQTRSMAQTGVQLTQGIWVADPVTAATSPEGIGLNVVGVSVAWSIATVAVGLAFLLSLAMYFREDEVARRLPVDEVRVMGAFLGVGSLVLFWCNWLLFQSGLPGLPIPLGTVLMGVLAGVLLTVDRAQVDEAGAGSDPDVDEEAGADPETGTGD